MSNNVTVKLNLPGLNAVMRSDAVCKLLDQAGRQIAAQAGEGYEAMDAKQLRWIGFGGVHAATWAAKRDNNANNTLLKAAGGVKL